MALEVASLLPFCSGNAGLSFNCDTGLVGVRDAIHELRFRYPGLDVPDLSWSSLHMGTRVRGPSWLTFLGQPLLGELGGASGLRIGNWRACWSPGSTTSYRSMPPHPLRTRSVGSAGSSIELWHRGGTLPCPKGIGHFFQVRCPWLMC